MNTYHGAHRIWISIQNTHSPCQLFAYGRNTCIIHTVYRGAGLKISIVNRRIASTKGVLHHTTCINPLKLHFTYHPSQKKLQYSVGFIWHRTNLYRGSIWKCPLITCLYLVNLGFKNCITDCIHHGLLTMDCQVSMTAQKHGINIFDISQPWVT